MKRLILLALIGFVYPNLSYANTQNICGSNIKEGIVICYDLKSYNKNPKISLEFGNGFKEQEDANPENYDWEIKYNLKANLVYRVVVKQNNKILVNKPYENMDYLDTEYDVYYNILQTNNRVQSDLISYKIHPKNFYPQYSNQLSQIIKTYKNLDENNFEIKKSEYIINALTPLLEPEKAQLKKIEDKRNSILGDDFNNYTNSLKEKSNQNKQDTINKIVDRVEKSKQHEQENKVKVEAFENALKEIAIARNKYDEIYREQVKLANNAKNQNDFSKIFNNVSGKNTQNENKWDQLKVQEEEQLAILNSLRNKYGREDTIERKIKELKKDQIKLNQHYETLEEEIKNEEENPDIRELSNELSECSIARINEDNSYYYYNIQDCYKEFITDKSKLEMLQNIDNLYIKQHKKVQFINYSIENNKSNIETITKKIESDKVKKELEAELR